MPTTFEQPNATPLHGPNLSRTVLAFAGSAQQIGLIGVITTAITTF